MCLPSPSPRNHYSASFSVNFTTPGFRRVCVVQYLSFHISLHSLSDMSSRFILIVVSTFHSFLRLRDIPWHAYAIFCLFIHLYLKEKLQRFWWLRLGNSPSFFYDILLVKNMTKASFKEKDIKVHFTMEGGANSLASVTCNLLQADTCLIYSF